MGEPKTQLKVYFEMKKWMAQDSSWSSDSHAAVTSKESDAFNDQKNEIMSKVMDKRKSKIIVNNV